VFEAQAKRFSLGFPHFSNLYIRMAEDGSARRVVNVDVLKAAEGMKLFEAEAGASVEYDTDGAKAFMGEHEAAIKALEEEVATLTGKDNKKAQTEKKKQVSAAKNDLKYIDATKVAKGLEPKNGNFIKSRTEAKKAEKAEPVVEQKEEPKKDDKKPKKADSTGISKEERDELEKLKKDIVTKKSELKAAGMSGGQQNKDPEVVKMVARMNELKEKESPGSTAKAGKEGGSSKSKKGSLSSEEQKEMDSLKGQIEEYNQRLVKEFGYSKKEIKADPEMQELEEKLKAFEKRA